MTYYTDDEISRASEVFTVLTDSTGIHVRMIKQYGDPILRRAEIWADLNGLRSYSYPEGVLEEQAREVEAASAEDRVRILHTAARLCAGLAIVQMLEEEVVRARLQSAAAIAGLDGDIVDSILDSAFQTVGE